MAEFANQIPNSAEPIAFGEFEYHNTTFLSRVTNWAFRVGSFFYSSFTIFIYLLLFFFLFIYLIILIIILLFILFFLNNLLIKILN